jgi:V8-like Glu-specific endopeptidase
MELSAAEKEFGVYGDEVMFGSDTLFRVPLEDMQKPLHKFTGALIFLTRSKKGSAALGKGTATLISPNLVLTCAHNVYNQTTGEVYKDFRFHPGHSGVLGEGYQVEDLFLPGKYVLASASEVAHDYCLLKLKKEVDTSDFIPLSGNVGEVTNDKKLVICGYPGKEYRPSTI